MIISKRIHIFSRVSQPAVFLFRRNFVRLRPPRTGSAGSHWYREPDEPIQVSQWRSDQLPVTFLSWGQGSAFSQVSYFLYIKCVVLYYNASSPGLTSIRPLLWQSKQTVSALGQLQPATCGKIGVNPSELALEYGAINADPDT